MQKQSYVGLDVSLAETSICVIDETGARLFEGKVITDSAVIAATVRRHVVGQVVRVGLETGTTAGWLWRELIALGLPAVCLDTRHAHTALSLFASRRPIRMTREAWLSSFGLAGIARRRCAASMLSSSARF